MRSLEGKVPRACVDGWSSLLLLDTQRGGLFVIEEGSVLGGCQMRHPRGAQLLLRVRVEIKVCVDEPFLLLDIF